MDADGGGTTSAEAIRRLLAVQIGLRNGRRLQTAIRASRLPAIKTLADFDLSFEPAAKREQIDALHELGFLERREDVVFLGPPASARPTWPSAWATQPPKAAARSTSNQGFECWGEILHDEAMAAVPRDRLLHRYHIVNIRGNSYRLRRHAELSKAIHPTAAGIPAAQRSGDGGSA